jgi:glycosyltransferase involved in cell wall biosynthesis
MALASIVIRTEGNRPDGLRRAVASVLAQTYRPLELIVVEDGGLAKSRLPPLAPSPEGVVFRHVPISKNGRSAAGNAGLSVAAGDWVGFLDDDDWLHPLHVATLASVLERHHNAGAAYGLAEEISQTRDGRKSGHRVVGDLPFSLPRLWLGNTLPIQAVLFRRSLFIDLGGFDEGVDALEDWDLWLRYALHRPFVGVDTITSTHVVPAERARRKARETAHAQALATVRLKHGADRAMLGPEDIRRMEASILSQLDDYVGARWCLGRLWRRLRTGR